MIFASLSRWQWKARRRKRRRGCGERWRIFVSSPALLSIFSFDPITASPFSSPLATHTLKESDGDHVTVSVHPGGNYFVCSTSKGGCKESRK